MLPMLRRDEAPLSPRFTRRRSNSRSSSDGSLRLGRAMSIPGLRFEDVPPPLPPPRFNEELAQGIDVAWAWANTNPFDHSQKSLPPIRPGSSLYSNSQPPYSNYPPTQEPSPVFSLHGDTPLAHENNARISQAYDQSLLSKIGKQQPSSSPDRSNSADPSHPLTRLSLRIKEPNALHLSPTDLSSASLDPASKWIPSPPSAALSPASRQNWRDYVDHGLSSGDAVTPPLAIDPDLFVPQRRALRASTGGSVADSDIIPNPIDESQRDSYVHSIFADADVEIANVDGHGFRILTLRDSQQQAGRPLSKQGLKRRARSPPSDMLQDDKTPQSSSLMADMLPLANTSSLPRSPIVRHQVKYGSVSSTSSSVRHNSYASSVAPSVAGSSMTSISSLERQSPLDPVQSTYLASAHLIASPVTSAAPARNLLSQSSHQSPTEATSPGCNMSSHGNTSESRHTSAKRFGNHFMCECCPKKPKKFDTEEDLRSHQMEKQYTCQYCNNRFKNKNEAERHQNSLHLRRQSWSCAAISNYQAIFHPAQPSTNLERDTSPTDACGFCGEEFANLPTPDWNHRIEHLTTVHKFGECNQAKRFYRADHFRQHLKHSHAGQSGRWTNILEATCLRTEQDTAAFSPVGSDSSPGRGFSSLPDHPMDGIREANDET
ncbi:hypothetical protein B0A52_06999 [Exophiala mesophila]|uniref:C2H2-type domain-containing protein n=1 Tax=Exophiala mesophila TaxID=212818 RepID=A0A438N1G8_EXOME|nr:hypothetical protein B0A52_06999 [Exophiala mesophila]